MRSFAGLYHAVERRLQPQKPRPKERRKSTDSELALSLNVLTGVSLHDRQELTCSALKSKYRIGCIYIHVLPTHLEAQHAALARIRVQALLGRLLRRRREGPVRPHSLGVYVDHLVGVR